MARATSTVPTGYSTVTPVITCRDAREQIEWYERAFGAKRHSISPGPDGKVMHADIQIGSSHVMLNDEVMGAKATQTIGGSPVELFLYVDDCDAVFDRAVKAGAKEKMRVDDQFWGDRMGILVDPFGLSWSVATHKEDLSPAEMKERQDQFFSQLAGKA